VFEVAYLDPNEVDLIGLSGSFPTSNAAQEALSAIRSRLGAEFIPERFIVLEIPDPIPVRFQIVFHDNRSKATWEGIPSNGKRYWHSEKAARIALNSLVQESNLECGAVDTKNFEVEEIQWKMTPNHKPPCGRFGRRVPWKIGILEDNSRRVYIRQ
jgi:hypothetical protein